MIQEKNELSPLTYEEAVIYYRSAVSYVSTLKQMDDRATTQWKYITTRLRKNLKNFYETDVVNFGSEDEKEEFRKYVISMAKKDEKKVGKEEERKGKE